MNAQNEKGSHVFFLVIAGNIGVGKTTLSELIGQKLGWKVYQEPVKENPYLAKFYKDMTRWSFHSQIFFLTQRFKSNLQIDKMNVPIIQDRSIYEDSEVFVNNLFKSNLISIDEYETYRELYTSMIEALKPPDLTLYLRASPWTLLSRIRKRWRDVERDIDKEYLFQLNLAYEKWIGGWQKQHKVLTIETDGRDFVQDLQWRKEIISVVNNEYEKSISISSNIKIHP